MKPMEAAFKGSKEIGFTIISITLSLVAVFIPVLFMGGVVGRVFREFAMTISMTILISGIVSLTLTPMLCSRVLKPLKHGAEQNFILRLSEAGFEALLRGYELGLKWVLAHRLPVLAFTFVTIFASVFMYHVVPKGFFPIEDTGFIYGVTEGAQDTSFAAMVERQKAVSDIVKADPDVDYVTSTTGAILSRPFLNTGSVFIALKTLGQERVPIHRLEQRLSGALPRRADARRPHPAAARLPGRDVRSADRDPPGLDRHRPRQGLAAQRRRRSDPQHALQRLRDPADLDHLHAVERLPGDHRCGSQVPERSHPAEPDLRPLLHRPAGPDRIVHADPADERPARRQSPVAGAVGPDLVQPGPGRFAGCSGRSHQAA